MANKYFIFSKQQLDDRIANVSKFGGKFRPGTVILGGVEKKYTEIADNMDNLRYSDSIMVGVGDLDTVRYTEPKLLMGDE